MGFWQTVFNDWTYFYQDPWFWTFPAATQLLSLVAFLVMALPCSYLAHKDPAWAQPYKIQDKKIPIAEYFWPSIGRLAVNNGVLFGLLILLWPILKHSGIHLGEMPAWYVIIAQLVFFILFDDFLYYWMHRYLHQNKWLMKHVHSVHHRVKNTGAIHGNYMHWAEFSATAGLMLLGPILVEAHLYVVFIWVIIRQYEAVDGHLGYDFPWNPAHWFPVYDGPVYHDYHHAKFNGNYAGFLPYVDKYMGKTHIEGFLDYEQKRQQGMLPTEIARQQKQRRKKRRN